MDRRQCEQFRYKVIKFSGVKQDFILKVKNKSNTDLRVGNSRLNFETFKENHSIILTRTEKSYFEI